MPLKRASLAPCDLGSLRSGKPKAQGVALPSPAIKARCWAPCCRRETLWTLRFPSLGLHGCTTPGCTATRELRGREALPRNYQDAPGYRPCPRRREAERAARREARATVSWWGGRGAIDSESRPTCACGRLAKVVDNRIVRTCDCDPDAPTCPKCSRAEPLCKCPKPNPITGA